MMRASVLIIAAAVATATTASACRDNPGFVFSAGGDGETGETGATTEATTGETAAETGPAVCTPTRESTGDACVDPPKRIPPPNLAVSDIFKNDACGTENQVYLKRTGDLLHTCTNSSCSECPLDVAVDISEAAEYGMVEAVLPPPGECVRVWHKSGNIDFTGLPCNTTGLAMFSVEDDDRLLFAVATSPDNPFENVSNFTFRMEGKSRTAACDGSSNQLCNDGPYALIDMDFTFGTCEIPGAVQSETWTNIVVDDRDYKLDVFAGFACFPVGSRAYTFYLHRV